VFWLIRFNGVEVIASYFSAAGRQRRMQRARDAEAGGGLTPVREAMIDEVKAKLLPQRPARG
jgi:hypothetical protein